MATEKKKVILLAEIQHGVMTDDGMKIYRFSPAKMGQPVKHTMLPIKIYNDLVDAIPPLFEDVVETIVEDLIDGEGETIELANANPKKGADAGPATQVADQNIVDASDLDLNEISEPVDVDAGAIKELKKIKGVGAGIAKTLVDAGFKSAYDVAYADEDHLIALDGISERNVSDIIDSAKELAE